MKRHISRFLFVFGLSISGVCMFSVQAQSNYVLKSGDTMTGTLSVEAQGDENNFQPALRIFGGDDQFKYIQLANTNSGAQWDLSMDTAADGDSLTFYYTPDGNNWLIPFSIDQSGAMYGDAYGLTNINVSMAIPNNSIGANKVAGDVVTTASLTNGSLNNIIIENGIVAKGSFVGGIPSTTTEPGLHAFSHGLANVATGNYSHAEGLFTTAGGTGSHAQGIGTKAYGEFSHVAGRNASALHDDTFVWSSSDGASSMTFSSTTNKQFNVYAHNGIRLVTGTDALVDISGDLNVAGAIKTIDTTTGSNVTIQVSNGVLLVDESPAGGSSVGDLDMTGNKVVNLGTASEDTDAASQGHVKTMMQQIPGYGDIPMGEFTSQVSMPDRPTSPGLMVNNGEIAINAVDSIAIKDGAITTTKLAVGAVTSDKIATNSISTSMLMPNIGFVPSGAIMAWPMEAVPAGWVACDGASYTNTVAQYTPLFSVIGHRYGGMGETFQVPDFRGYFLRGWDGGSERDPGMDFRTPAEGSSLSGEVGSTQAESHNSLTKVYHTGADYEAPLEIDVPDDGTISDWVMSDRGEKGSASAMKFQKTGSETRPKNIYVKWIIKL